MRFNSVPFLGLIVAVAGCHVVKNVQPAQYIPEHHPPIVWVTYTDNSFVPVSGPKIVGDTLVGTWSGLSEPVAIPLNEIQTVQAKMPAPKRTVLLVTIVTAATVGVAYTIATAGNGGDPSFLGCPRVKGTPTPDCPQGQ